MPTRPVESTHDSPSRPQAATAEPRRSSPENSRAEAGADHDTASPGEAANPAVSSDAEASAKAAKVESPAGGNMQGTAGPPHETNADDEPHGDQDIDTAGTAHDDESPTKRF